jgi:hypothetical protein
MKYSVAALLLLASVHISHAEVLVPPSNNPAADVRLFLTLTNGGMNSYCVEQEGSVTIADAGTPEMDKAIGNLSQCVRRTAFPEMEDLYSRAVDFFRSKGMDGAISALKRYVVKKQSQYQAAVPTRGESRSAERERTQKVAGYEREADEAARELKLELKTIR